jgi:Domain of unknown function (DUF4388)
MSLVGRLEDLALSDIFQIISLSKKTGTLVLKGAPGAAVVVFKDGQVIQAATDDLRDTLGNILISKGLIGEPELMAALDEQKKLKGAKRLGQILVEMGHLDQDMLEDTIREQIEGLIYSLLGWEDGFFNFELGDVTPTDKIEVSTHEFLLKAGINPEYLLMEGARVMDEKKRDEKGKPRPKAKAPEAAAPDDTKKKSDSEFAEFLEEHGITRPSAPTGEERALMERSREMNTLKAMFEELRFPSATAEITLLVLRYASELVSRSVLFMVTKDDIRGLGQFGIELPDGESADMRVRKIHIPVSEPSIFSKVLKDRRSVIGAYTGTAWDEYLIEEMGGTEPPEYFLVPLISNGKVAAMLYGDNLPEGRPIPNITGLEIFVHQAGLAMEKALLERKLMELERLRASG